MSYLRHVLFFFILFAVVATGCKKKDDLVTSLPMVTTGNIIAITGNTATGEGIIIIGNGITASGLCYSKVNHTPTISDDTTKGNTSIGIFTANMKNLTPGATYYVRAYAINDAGTGFGDVVSFQTAAANTAPEARNVSINGNVKVAERIVARYTYSDAENDPENATRFQWYISNDSTGSPVTSIANATDSTYTLIAADENKFFRVGIIPASSTGTSPGTETFSAWVGPVHEVTSVTFSYNGQAVTYGIITSAITHRKWLDRNLGAPDVATAYNDWKNMGDLFQWGRKADGHQLINKGATSQQITAVNGITNQLSSTDNPGHSLFILISGGGDWRFPQNPDLWQVSGGVNNVCPVGWHVPSKEDWQAEQLGNVQDAFNKLKITLTGDRNYITGELERITTNGYYWSSTSVEISFWYYAETLNVYPNNPADISPADHPFGQAIRCIKD